MATTKVCIVTGSSSGLGLLTAKKLVEKGFHVIFACRDEVKTMPILHNLKEESGRSNFEFMKLDLGSFDSIRRSVTFSTCFVEYLFCMIELSRFVGEFQSKKLSLSLLINNAGVCSRTFVKSNDGIEYTFAVNHLGHCEI